MFMAGVNSWGLIGQMGFAVGSKFLRFFSKGVFNGWFFICGGDADRAFGRYDGAGGGNSAGMRCDFV